VHQIVSGEPPRRRKLPRAAGGMGAALVLAAATVGALRIAHAPPFVQAVPAAQEAVACLSGHGWSVAQHSSGVIVATDGLYRLVTSLLGERGRSCRPAGAATGPMGPV
jgi:hypothetical protein